MNLVEVKRISYYPPSKGYAVLLQERDSSRSLPIIVGSSEAQAIALYLEGVDMPRPMTHDLLGSVIGNLGGSVQRIIVSELKNDTFFAKIVVDYNGNSIEIDSRPSDALALAVRTNAPIFAEDDVVEQAGVNLDVEMEESESTDDKEGASAPVAEEELERLSAYTDFIDSLDLDDLGKDG